MKKKMLGCIYGITRYVNVMKMRTSAINIGIIKKSRVSERVMKFLKLVEVNEKHVNVGQNNGNGYDK